VHPAEPLHLGREIREGGQSWLCHYGGKRYDKPLTQKSKLCQGALLSVLYYQSGRFCCIV
jgi:hypothetical protein